MKHLPPFLLFLALFVSGLPALAADPASGSEGRPQVERNDAPVLAQDEVVEEDAAPSQPAASKAAPVNPLLAGGVAGGVAAISAPVLGGLGFLGGGLCIGTLGCGVGAGLGAIGSLLGLLIAGVPLSLDAVLPIGLSAALGGGVTAAIGLATIIVGIVLGTTIPFAVGLGIAIGAGVLAGLVTGVGVGLVTGFLAPQGTPPAPATVRGRTREEEPVLAGAMAF